MKSPLSLSMLMVCAMALVSAPAAADTKAGKKAFKKKCASCHEMDKHKAGPMLKGVIGRKAGSTDFSKYRALKGADFTWDENNLNEWIANPKKFIGKTTPMTAKVKKEKDRLAIIEYLKSEAD